MADRQIIPEDKEALKAILENPELTTQEQEPVLRILVDSLAIDSRLAIFQCLSPARYKLAEADTSSSERLTQAVVQLLQAQSSTFSSRIRALLGTDGLPTATQSHNSNEALSPKDNMLTSILAKLPDNNSTGCLMVIDSFNKEECIYVLSRLAPDKLTDNIFTLKTAIRLLVSRLNTKFQLNGFKDALKNPSNKSGPITVKPSLFGTSARQPIGPQMITPNWQSNAPTSVNIGDGFGL